MARIPAGFQAETGRIPGGIGTKYANELGRNFEAESWGGILGAEPWGGISERNCQTRFWAEFWDRIQGAEFYEFNMITYFGIKLSIMYHIKFSFTKFNIKNIISLSPNTE